ncbi:hypothetical protein Tco_1172391 [Tanacetum coccineum]
MDASLSSSSSEAAQNQKGFLDEQQRKISVTDEGTGAKPGVSDMMTDDEMKPDIEDDEGNDGDDDNDGDDNDGDDDDDDGNDDDVDLITERLKDDADYAKEENEEELDDTKELYKDVNVNLRKEDVEITNADQGGADQHNVSQESGFEQQEEEAHVTLTIVHDIQKTEGQCKVLLSHLTS